MNPITRLYKRIKGYIILYHAFCHIERHYQTIRDTASLMEKRDIFRTETLLLQKAEEVYYGWDK